MDINTKKQRYRHSKNKPARLLCDSGIIPQVSSTPVVNRDGRKTPVKNSATVTCCKQ